MLECIHLCFPAYELTADINVIGSTDIHTFHIICICPCTNMPATLHMSFPLHVYYTLHIDQTLLQISVK